MIFCPPFHQALLISYFLHVADKAVKTKLERKIVAYMYMYRVIAIARPWTGLQLVSYKIIVAIRWRDYM